MVLPKSRLNIPVRRTPLKDLSAMVKNAKTLLTRAVIGRVSPKLQSKKKLLMKTIKQKNSMVLPKLQSTKKGMVTKRLMENESEHKGGRISKHLMKTIVDE